MPDIDAFDFAMPPPAAAAIFSMPRRHATMLAYYCCRFSAFDIYCPLLMLMMFAAS